MGARSHNGRTLYAYESGPTKFQLCRDLQALGYDCGVVAVTTLGRSQKQRRQKTDASDARALLADVSGHVHDFSWCWVPSVEAERARDLCRLWRSAADDLVSARQAVSSYLLGKDVVWDERTPSGGLRSTWTKAYLSWLDGVERGMDPTDGSILSKLRERVDWHEGYAREVRNRVVELGQTERWRPYVDSLSCLLGVSPETALLAAAEFDDFSRFTSGRRVRNWLGVAPSEHSSGEGVSHGRATKGGPACLRKCMVEGLASLSMRKTAEKHLRVGQEPVPEAMRVARKGNRRVFVRYRGLVERGKSANKARVAMVAEEACWMWQVGLEVRASLG